MRILVTGRGTSGSWQIRGVQLGEAIGAHVEANASKLDGFELGIVVKRCPMEFLQRARDAKLPLVYDVLDGWPQPIGNHEWRRYHCMEWLRRQVHIIKPVALVAATRVMAADCLEFGLPVLALPHHARQDQPRNPIREQVRRIGYEGGPHYLGRWHDAVARYCHVRGIEFVINPTSLDAVDIVLALRDCVGYAARHWKSNVKLANAQGTATPCIVDKESAYVETASGGEVWVEGPNDAGAAIESLATQKARIEASKKLAAGTLRLDAIAHEYKTWLQALSF